MKLDKSKPFGEVWGDSAGQAKYVQGGHYFNHEGEPCEFGEPDRPAATIGTGNERYLPAQAPEVDAQTIIEARHGRLMLQALPLLEGKVEDILGELEDHDVDLLSVMYEVEALTKKRKTLLEALQEAVTLKRSKEAQDAAANGQGEPNPSDSQLSDQLQS